MSLNRQISLALAAAVLAVACGGGASQQQPPATQAAPPTQAAAPAAPAGEAPAVPAEGAPAAAPAAGGAEFGVAECDSYMSKYVACVDSKVPEAARAMLRQSLDQTKETWKRAASTPQGKAGLAQACTQAEAAAKTAMAAYGCQW